MATLGIPSNTIALLQTYNFTFQKKFGQNFLIDPHVLEKIVDAAGVTKEDCVVEIGPGIGTMTQYLAERAGRVVAVEIDRALIPIRIANQRQIRGAFIDWTYRKAWEKQ